MMGGKSDYCPESVVSLLQGLQNLSASLLSGLPLANSSSFRVVYNDGSNTADAVATAKSADFTIVTRGGVQGSEGMDRVALTLDDTSMNNVTAAIAAAVPASKLALVVVVGEPVALEMYQGSFGAIVLLLEGGQAAGTALADVVSGRTNPSGALPFTMHAASFVNEVKMDDMAMRPGNASKGRTYRFYTGRAVWPFGFGLSYTNFSLAFAATVPRAATVPAATLQHGVLSFDVVVANTGALAGATALQLYVRTPDVPDSPLSTLVAFDKVAVAAGRTVTVTLKTGVVDGTCAFCLYSATGAPSVPVGTRYEVFVGNGAGPLAPIVNVTAS
jgi:hypothetical protein